MVNSNVNVSRNVSCTGRKHGFVYWVLRCLDTCVCVCVYRVLLRYDYVFQWHRCRYTFGNLCFIIKDTYMKHKWNERISKEIVIESDFKDNKI